MLVMSFFYGVYKATFMIQLPLFLPENWNNIQSTEVMEDVATELRKV